MANKLVNITQLEYDLSRIADAIRDKGIASGNLTFPDGMVNAINESSLTSLSSFSEASEEITSGTAVFKTVNETTLNDYIAQVAAAIRNKTGYDSLLTFPNGIIGAINAMSELVYVASGTYTYGQTTNSTIGSGTRSGYMYVDADTASIKISGTVDGSSFNYIEINLNENAEIWTIRLYDTNDMFMPVWDSDYHGGTPTIILPDCFMDSSLWEAFDQVLNPNSDPDPEPEPSYITFYYQSTSYSVISGTTWGNFVDSGTIASLGIQYVDGTAYIYDSEYDSYVGTYTDNAPVKASDSILDHESYYYGFNPGSSTSTISFLLDGESYSAEEGTTWYEWVNSGNARSDLYVSTSGNNTGVYSDNGWIGFTSDISAGNYYAPISAYSTINDGGVYTSYMSGFAITFYINGVACTCASNAVWVEWIDANSGITLNGTYYHFNYNSYGSYVAFATEYDGGILTYNGEAIYYSANIQEGASYETTSSFLYGTYDLTDKSNATSAFSVSLSSGNPFASITARRLYSDNGDVVLGTFTDDIYQISGNTGSTSITLEQGYGYTGSYTVPNVEFNSINQSGYNISRYYPCSSGGAYNGIGPATSVVFYTPVVVSTTAYAWFNS